MDHQAVNGTCPRGVEGCPCFVDEEVDRISELRSPDEQAKLESALESLLEPRAEEVSDVYVVRWLGPKVGKVRARMYLQVSSSSADDWDPAPATAHRWTTPEAAARGLSDANARGPSPVGMMGGTVRVVKRVHCLYGRG